MRLDELSRKINEDTVRDYNAELVLQALRDFEKCFSALIPEEQAEALQCILKGVTVSAEKLTLEVFELEEFAAPTEGGSQIRQSWLPGQDSNLRPFG